FSIEAEGAWLGPAPARLTRCLGQMVRSPVVLACLPPVVTERLVRLADVGARLEEASDSRVLRAPGGSRQRPVGDVVDEAVPEGELLVPLDTCPRLTLDELTRLERPEDAREVVLQGHLGKGAPPEHAAD